MKVLTYGDNPKISSGYGQIWDNLLGRWAQKGLEVFHVGWQNRNRKHKTLEGYTMLPLSRVDYGFDTVVQYLKEINPDFMITLGDIGVQAGFVDPVFEARRRGWKGKWIAYTQTDSDSWEYVVWGKMLDAADINVALADWTFQMFYKNNVHDLHVIPCGVDLETFRPLDNREEIRDRFKINDKFVVGFIGKNQRRKMIVNLIKGFAQFAKGKEDVKLVLHTEVKPPQSNMSGWILPVVLEKYAHEVDPNLFTNQKIILSKDDLDPAVRQNVAPTELNELYNVFDLFGYATGGEGFGLPAIECQASGVPLMMTACTTAFELCDKHGILLPVLKDEYGRDVKEIGQNGIENFVPNDVELARLLDIYYQDWKAGGKVLKEKSKQSRKFAEKYSWEDLADRWIDLMEKNVD